MKSNAELIREGFGAFSEGRFDDALASMHPEVEWHIAFRLPDLPPGQEVAHGHQEVMRVWEMFTSVWDRLVFDPEEIVFDEGNTVIARIHVHATGGESGVDVDRVLYYLLRLEDGLLRRIAPYDSLQEARAAGGLPAV